MQDRTDKTERNQNQCCVSVVCVFYIDRTVLGQLAPRRRQQYLDKIKCSVDTTTSLDEMKTVQCSCCFGPDDDLTH